MFIAFGVGVGVGGNSPKLETILLLLLFSH